MIVDPSVHTALEHKYAIDDTAGNVVNFTIFHIDLEDAQTYRFGSDAIGFVSVSLVVFRKLAAYKINSL